MLDGRRGGSCGGEDLRRETGGTIGGVEDLDAVGEQCCRVCGQGWRKEVDGVAGARGYGDMLDGDAGGSGRGGGIGLAAEFGGDVALDVEAVRVVGRGGPVELDLVADAMGGEIGDDFGKVERGGAGIAWAGAADGEGKKCCEACAETSAVLVVPLVLRKIHWLSA